MCLEREDEAEAEGRMSEPQWESRSPELDRACQGDNSPGPSNSHSSPANTLSPFLSSKSSKALRCRAVLGRTTCSGVMS
jgi:hypothetical protein